MLTDLRVQGLGVIEDLSLTFGQGMTALTGETGAGKTLVVEALNLVLGSRATSGLVRAGSDEALVEARFVGSDDPAAVDGELILTRSVAAGGRSRAWINGRMVPVGVLAEAGARLVDIHGQHEHQSLIDPAAQRQALDTFAGADPSPAAEARRALADIDRRLAELGGDEHARARAADFLRHQLAEIAGAHLDDPDEETALVAEEERLSDLAAHRQAAAVALSQLDASDAGGANGLIASGDGTDTLTLLGQAVAALAGRPAFEALEQRLREISADADDVAHELRSIVETWEDDPVRLGEVQERRHLLADLRRKYGRQLADVLAFAESAAEQLRQVDDAEQIAASLTEARQRAVVTLTEAEAALRSVRLAGAPGLAEAVESHLVGLAMPGARLEVHVAAEGPGEPIRFMLGANVGEPLQALAKVASGGELARAMLALRLVASGGPATMVFDEVDAGVGGSAALALGRALKEVASQHQVLVVTHLAQVAAFAHAQVAVHKESAGGRTVTTASTLEPQSRTVELSRMLSGQSDSEAARATANELLALAGSTDLSTTGAPGRV